MGIRDVPFFYINGEEYKGGVNTSAMSKVIDGFLKKKVAVKTSSKAAATDEPIYLKIFTEGV